MLLRTVYVMLFKDMMCILIIHIITVYDMLSKDMLLIL